MSTRELENKVQALDENDLVRFGIWFDAYREERLPERGEEADDEVSLSSSQRAEIERRLDSFDADPSIALPWEGTIEIVKARLEKLRADKTARR